MVAHKVVDTVTESLLSRDSGREGGGYMTLVDGGGEMTSVGIGFYE